MARKIEKIIMEEATVEKELEILVSQYAENKERFDTLKKAVEIDNNRIKLIMSENHLTSFETDKYIAGISVSNKDSFNEELLLDTLKKMKKLPEGIIKTKEYVDMDVLESAIYNAKIDATKLVPCQEHKEIISLRIKRKKEI